MMLLLLVFEVFTKLYNICGSIFHYMLLSGLVVSLFSRAIIWYPNTTYFTKFSPTKQPLQILNYKWQKENWR